SEPEDCIVEPQIAFHLKTGKAYVHPIQIGHDVKDEQVRHDPPNYAPPCPLAYIGNNSLFLCHALHWPPNRLNQRRPRSRNRPTLMPEFFGRPKTSGQANNAEPPVALA